jgi:hypothetical protein
MSWQAYLSTVTVSTLIPMRLGVEQRDGREYAFVELSVPCSRTGEPITVKTAKPVQPLGLLTDAEAAATVRDLVRIAVLHEIDEAIGIAGERVFDPHRGAR